MSTSAMKCAWQQECELGAKFVLVSLADNANDTGNSTSPNHLLNTEAKP